MTVVSVTTDHNIGPYFIPSNAQNMIMNEFARRNGLKIEVVVPEPIGSRNMATTIWLSRDFDFTQIILCSIYQIPPLQENLGELVKNLPNAEYFFAIEGLIGSGLPFLRECLDEIDALEKSTRLESVNVPWSTLNEHFRKMIPPSNNMEK